MGVDVEAAVDCEAAMRALACPSVVQLLCIQFIV